MSSAYKFNPFSNTLEEIPDPVAPDVSGQVLSTVLTGLDTTAGAVTAVDSVLGSIGKLTGRLSAVEVPVAQVLVVAKTGGDYATIQAAINAVTDASASKPYVVKVEAGLYTANVVMKDYVFVTAANPFSATIVGKVTGTINAQCALQGFNISLVSAADGEIAVSTDGTGLFVCYDCSISISGAGNFSCTGFSRLQGSGSLNTVGVVDRRTTASITKDSTGFALGGAASWVITNISYSGSAAYASGTHTGVACSSTGVVSATSGKINFTSTVAFSGEVRGFYTSTASTGLRLWQGFLIRLLGTSGGTAYGFCINTSSGAGEQTYTGCALFIDGFTNEYSTNAAVTDSQKVWLQSCNKDLAKSGAGLSILTPYDENHSGFIEFDSAGATYWGFVPATRVFTLNKRATGLVKSSPVIGASGQTVTLTNYAVNIVYLTSAGVLASTTTYTEAIPTGNVVLFQVYSDGTNYIVKKETHPVSFNQSASLYLHGVLGAVIENNGGANITLLSGANRTIKMVTASTAIDHGLNTVIPDSAGAAISFTSFYTSASGTAIDETGITQIPTKYQQSGTALGNAANNARCVVRVGVILDSLNSSAPQYVFVYHNAVFTGGGAATAAANAIAANNITAFPPALVGLEVIQLGFITLLANGSGTGSITVVDISKRTIASNATAGAASTSAGNVVTVVSNFAGVLSATDTSVQLALDTLDDHTHLGVATEATPAAANAAGVKGSVRWDAGFVYVCVDTNTWKRAAISTWS